jgi:hypothetical protein
MTDCNVIRNIRRENIFQTPPEKKKKKILDSHWKSHTSATRAAFSERQIPDSTTDPLIYHMSFKFLSTRNVYPHYNYYY